LRTLDEVTRWPLMSDEERTRVNLRIALENQTPPSLPLSGKEMSSG
jgi:predicted Fe-S protein YdhL (DUF1289 family)